MAKGALTFTGEIRTYDKAGDSGETITRGFCPTCGSLIYDDIAGGITIVAAGTLDDPDTFEPAVAIFTRSRPKWSAFAAEVMEFETAAPR